MYAASEICTCQFRKAGEDALQALGSKGEQRVEQNSYARKKFWEALNILVGDGPLRKRFGFVYGMLLILNVEKDFPEDLRERFTKLIGQMDERKVGGQNGPIEINVDPPLSDELAEEVLAIYTNLRGGI